MGEVLRPADGGAQDELGSAECGDGCVGAQDELDVAEHEEVVTAVEYSYSIKADNLDLAEVVPYIEALAGHGIDLFLCVRPWHLGTPELAACLETAASGGVEVRLWPLLDWNDGSWCCEDTLDLCLEHIGAAMDSIEGLVHSVDTVVVNMELAHPKIDEFKAMVASGDLAAAEEYIMANRNPEVFIQSQAKVQAIVDAIHQHGYLAMVNTYPFIMDDFADGDTDVQDVANVPVAGISWDMYSFTAYTTSYTADIGFQFGPYYPYSYGQLAKELFGESVEIAVGLLPHDDSTGYASPADMQADVAAVKSAGVASISAFDLEGMTNGGNMDEWAEAFLAPPEVPAPDQGTALMHLFVKDIDAKLNLP